LANGTYVFQMSGDVNFGDSFITGALVARDGAIVGGEQDSLYYGNTHAPINRIPSGIYPYDQFQPISGGSYASTPDGNLQITIQLGNGASEVLCGTLAAGGKGFISGFDGAPFSGTMDLETSTAAPQGGYVLSLRGENDWGTPASLGGVVNIDGAGAISGTGSLLDVYSAMMFGGRFNLERAPFPLPTDMGGWSSNCNRVQPRRCCHFTSPAIWWTLLIFG
jgi:hypothetical protein